MRQNIDQSNSEYGHILCSDMEVSYLEKQQDNYIEQILFYQN